VSSFGLYFDYLIPACQPIPLELLSLASFSDPPQQRGTAFLKFQRDRSVTASGLNGVNGNDTPADSRSVYPLTIHHNGRMGGLYTLYAENSDARVEWKTKLEEALALRSVIQDSNKASCRQFSCMMKNLISTSGIRDRTSEL
jgi:hypothetical protein